MEGRNLERARIAAGQCPRCGENASFEAVQIEGTYVTQVGHCTMCETVFRSRYDFTSVEISEEAE